MLIYKDAKVFEGFDLFKVGHEPFWVLAVEWCSLITSTRDCLMISLLLFDCSIVYESLNISWKNSGFDKTVYIFEEWIVIWYISLWNTLLSYILALRNRTGLFWYFSKFYDVSWFSCWRNYCIFRMLGNFSTSKPYINDMF